MKVVPFAFPAAVVVAATIGLFFLGITIPPFKKVTAAHHDQSAPANKNTNDGAGFKPEASLFLPDAPNIGDQQRSINQQAGLKKSEASMLLPDAPAAALNDQQRHYHMYTMSRKLDSSCEDSPLKVLTKKGIKSAKTCAFLGKKPTQRCKGRVIKSHCPNACKSCESFGTSDSKATFIFDGAKTTCTWLHDLVTRSTLTEVSSWCQLDSLRATCRETCSFFCADGPEESNAPSPSPTTCSDKITSIIDEHFGDVTKGPPQEEAYSWLIEDITDDECDDEAKIMQRYILAVFYFSTGGEDWDYYEGSWLGSGNECNWGGVVFCNDNQQVTNLFLSYLNGTIPAELSLLTNLEQLWLIESKLSGSIPPSIFQLPKLEQLVLYINDLTGTIPDNFGGSTSLRHIDLAGNLLTGTIPDITGDSLQSIGALYLNWNKMSGPVPDSICELRSSKPNQFTDLGADCAPPDNAQNPCPSGCCTLCTNTTAWLKYPSSDFEP